MRSSLSSGEFEKATRLHCHHPQVVVILSVSQLPPVLARRHRVVNDDLTRQRPRATQLLPPPLPSCPSLRSPPSARGAPPPVMRRHLALVLRSPSARGPPQSLRCHRLDLHPPAMRPRDRQSNRPPRPRHCSPPSLRRPVARRLRHACLRIARSGFH